MSIEHPLPSARRTRGTTEVQDPEILRILAAVEAIHHRGDADALVAPLRGRLLLLRPPRPLRFSRLLFHPIDPLIVNAGRWHPARQSFPRSMLGPMSTCVMSALGATAARIEEQLAGRTTAETDLIERLGGMLWPAAACVLAWAEPPDDWVDTGMSAAHFRDLARAAGALLDQAAALDGLCESTVDGLVPCSSDALLAILEPVAAAHEPALGMMMSLILTRLPDAAATLARAYEGAGAGRLLAVLYRTADLLVARMEQDAADLWIGPASNRDQAGRLRRTVALLRQLEAMKGSPGRRERCRDLRLRLDATCKARLATSVAHDLIEPMLTSSPPPAPVLESAARALRFLEIEARGLVDDRPYDALLARAIEALKSPAAAERLALTERARLVEILGGPGEALSLLDRGGYAARH